MPAWNWIAIALLLFYFFWLALDEIKLGIVRVWEMDAHTRCEWLLLVIEPMLAVPSFSVGVIVLRQGVANRNLFLGGVSFLWVVVSVVTLVLWVRNLYLFIKARKN
jgi:hypothetical protein